MAPPRGRPAFGFDDIGEAIDLQATRHVRGKLAITVG
jgi:hypothetical protein